MNKLGFASKWTELVLNCITLSSFFILVNGIPNKKFKPQRGLKQGCPLSLYLCILYVEALSAQLFVAISKGLLTVVH